MRQLAFALVAVLTLGFFIIMCASMRSVKTTRPLRLRRPARSVPAGTPAAGIAPASGSAPAPDGSSPSTAQPAGSTQPPAGTQPARAQVTVYEAPAEQQAPLLVINNRADRALTATLNGPQPGAVTVGAHARAQMQLPPGAYQITVRFADGPAVQDTRALSAYHTYTLECEVAK